MIVRDEEAVLPRCLESVKDLVHEMVVVDTGSVDSTPDIIQKYTGKVPRFTWVNDFAAARNYSFSLCTGDFIIWLDADDVIPEEEVRKIRNLDFSGKELIISPYIYNHDEFGNDDLVVPRERIIKRSLGDKWEGRIHEYFPMTSPHQYVSDFKVHHYRRHVSSDRNIGILEEIVKGGNPLPGAIVPGVDSRYVLYLGREYQDMGRHEEAIPYLQEFVDRRDGFWEYIFNAYYRLGQCHFILHNFEAGLRAIYQCIEIEPRQSEPYCLLGDYYSNKGEFRKAIHWYEVATQIQRPAELLSSYQPKFYTWLPYLNLCLCYNQIGEVDKAYDANQKVLQYRPKDPAALNNKAILGPGRKRDKYKKDGRGKKLNLGCGGKPIEGYVGVDLFKGPTVDEVFEIHRIPYKADSIGGIYSEHALEHLSFGEAEEALTEWYRVLEPGAELILKMPDFEDCCKHYLAAPLNHSSFFRTRCWYKFTVFGIQKSQSGEPDAAQFHRCGFSKEEIKIVLERTGFQVNSIVNYDGWSTPSMEIHAIKPVKGPQIAWIAPENWDSGPVRLRILNVNQWLKSHGYGSKVTDWKGAESASVVVVGKVFDQETLTKVREFKTKGKRVICDLCEDIFQYPFVSDILRECDQVVCCSYALEEKAKVVNPHTVTIEEAWE